MKQQQEQVENSVNAINKINGCCELKRQRNNPLATKKKSEIPKKIYKKDNNDRVKK